MSKKENEAAAETQRKEAAVKAGRAVGLSGRDLFAFRPELFQVRWLMVLLMTVVVCRGAC